MTLLARGENTSTAEVTGISSLGLWLLAGDREYFVPFEDYPDFLQATVEQIYRLDTPSPTQLHWPDLDVDIDLGALAQPQNYPLSFKR